MSDRPRLAQLATDALAAEHVVDHAPDPAVAARTIAAMTARIERSATRRALGRGAIALAVAAALVLGVGGTVMSRRSPSSATATAPPAVPAASAHVNVVAHAEGDGAVIVHDGRELALGDDVALSAGDHVVSAATGHATILLSSGTRLTLAPGSDVSVVRHGLLLVFSLDAGSLRAEAPTRGASDGFVVRTNDAEIESRGARFRVTSESHATCAGKATSVEVDDGALLVRSGGNESRVEAGARWPSTCTPPAPPGPAASAPRAKRAAKGAPPRDRTEMTPEETSELKAQTSLFGSAVAAKRHGDTRGAIARFEQYASRYPDSALAEAAAVQDFELLATVEHARAVEAARAYLQHYPAGFGRDEASAILAGGSP